MLGFGTIRQKFGTIGQHDTRKRILFVRMLDRRHTRVVCRTLAKRGKSLTLESRIEMLDRSRLLLERREETQDASTLAMM